MVFLMLKASDYEWFDFVEYSTLEEMLIDMEKSDYAFILDKNQLKADPDRVKEWLNIESDYIANQIAQCEYEITIYDSYIE